MLRFEQPLKIGRMQNQLLTIGFAQPHRLFHHRTSTTPPLYHPYSTTFLRSLRLKNSQTLRVPRGESWLFSNPPSLFAQIATSGSSTRLTQPLAWRGCRFSLFSAKPCTPMINFFARSGRKIEKIDSLMQREGERRGGCGLFATA